MMFRFTLRPSARCRQTTTNGSPTNQTCITLDVNINFWSLKKSTIALCNILNDPLNEPESLKKESCHNQGFQTKSESCITLRNSNASLDNSQLGVQKLTAQLLKQHP